MSLSNLTVQPIEQVIALSPELITDENVFPVSQEVQENTKEEIDESMHKIASNPNVELESENIENSSKRNSINTPTQQDLIQRNLEKLSSKNSLEKLSSEKALEMAIGLKDMKDLSLSNQSIGSKMNLTKGLSSRSVEIVTVGDGDERKSVLEESEKSEDETKESFENSAVETKTQDSCTEFNNVQDHEDWLSDLDVEEITKRKNVLDQYLFSCKVLGIVPASYFLKRISSSNIVMKYHGLGPKGAQAIAEVLEYNSTIKHLDLTGNHCFSGGFNLGESLRTNQTLITLNLSKNNLKNYGGKEFSEMLMENNTLKTLILKENKLTDDEAVHLAQGLKHNNTLLVLDLSGNEIGDIGAGELGLGLSQNDGLKELNLSWNHIRPRGTTAFFTNIKENVTLTHLNFDSNGIADNGAQIANFLQRNAGVQILSLKLTDTGLTQIAKGIEAAEIKEGRLKLDELKNAKPDLNIME
ncbi:hypothetical protein HK099_002961 [Clydaea vesicula]|uniref:Uncharacterized protein n=1 Tax=Clydaea vesicula TaxID=447962 RepID=A0AAD5XWK4_9FUNG|nr:hypothetical protein HK099_002961 [Clydaea vesicula]